MCGTPFEQAGSRHERQSREGGRGSGYSGLSALLEQGTGKRSGEVWVSITPSSVALLMYGHRFTRVT